MHPQLFATREQIQQHSTFREREKLDYYYYRSLGLDYTHTKDRDLLFKKHENYAGITPLGPSSLPRYQLKILFKQASEHFQRNRGMHIHQSEALYCKILSLPEATLHYGRV